MATAQIESYSSQMNAPAESFKTGDKTEASSLAAEVALKPGERPFQYKADSLENDRAFLPELNFLEKGKTTKESLTINGEKCEYYLRVPESYDESKPMPLILAFHGYGKSRGQGDVAPGAPGMEEMTGLSERAEKEGFIVAYLNGDPTEKNAWNNGQWFFSDRDDTRFTREVMDRLTQDFNVDTRRVYMVGFSNGASFVHKAANELSDRVAAVADVSGWMTGKEKSGAKGVSVLSIHSEDDPSVPYKGRGIIQGVVMKPSVYTPEHYRTINDLPATPNKTVETAANGSEIETYQWLNEKTGTEVKSIFIEKEGHVWFGGKANEKAPVNATDEILKFFKSKSKEQP
jgi:polyhydroxybutyrate depolymerase